MKMKNNFIILIIMSLFIVSCNEEAFLDKKPHTPTDVAFYTTQDGAVQGINAAYDILQRGEALERIELAGTTCSGDALAGGEPGGGDQPMLQRISDFSAIPTNTFWSTGWATLYQGIYRCNLVINYLSKPIDGFDETLRNRLVGEATFLRGLFHFKLQINFGGFPQLQGTFNNQLKGVPFIDHVLLTEEWNQERPTLEYTWERIENDFATAATLLPASYDANNIGRATSNAAKAMLAKTYLYQEKWDKAYSTAKEVINSGVYKLMGENGEKFTITRIGKNGEFQAEVPGYKWIWQPEANNCEESVFDVQHFMDGDGAFGTQEGNILPRYYGPRGVKTFTYDPATKTTKEVTTEHFWGFILPTRYFVETAYKNIGGVDSEGKIVDPRFKLTVVTPEDKVPYYYAKEADRAMFPDSVYVDPFYNDPATGNVTWKYFTDPFFDMNRAGLGDMPQNTKYFRFADLLLIGAEAAVHAGNTSDALAWINRVRTRARNSGNTGFPKDLSAVSLEDIYAERRVELAFESHQFYDIVRTGRAKKVLIDEALQYATNTHPKVNEDGTITNVTVREQFGDVFVPGKNEFWAIPQTEIDNTSGSLTQNPGW